MIASHLKQEDWYSELTDGGKTIWDFAVSGFISKCKSFRCRGEAQIYWDVITICEYSVRDHLKREPIISRFGTTPFRYHASSQRLRQPDVDFAFLRDAIEDEESDLDGQGNDDDLGTWFPYHSVHSPDEVQTMIEELESVEQVIEATRDPQTIGDYANELLPALDRIVAERRGLMVVNDT